MDLKDREELGMPLDEHQPIVRVSNPTYKMTDEEYYLREKKKDIVQFATFYWLRLQSLMPQVKEAAEIKWHKTKNLKWVNNILDIRPNE